MGEWGGVEGEQERKERKKSLLFCKTSWQYNDLVARLKTLTVSIAR
jgi:hypothetical protein